MYWPRDQARILINVHDCLIALCKHEVKHLVAKLLVEHAQEPIDVNGRPMIIPADCKVSFADDGSIHRWSNLKGLTLD